MARAAADDDVRVVVLAGAGRAFSAGYDLSAEADETALDTAAKWRELLRKRRRDDDAHLVAAQADHRGRARLVPGRRMEVAMACDLLICTEDARFGEPEIRYGSGPVTLLMPFVLGERRDARAAPDGRHHRRADGAAAGGSPTASSPRTSWTPRSTASPPASRRPRSRCCG